MKAALTERNIQQAVDEAEQFLQTVKADRKDKVRVRLWIEESLLQYREAFGEDAEFIIKFGSTLGRKKIKITVPGDMYDPFRSEDDEAGQSSVLRSFMTQLGQRPTWRYGHRENSLTFYLPGKRLSCWTSLALSVVLAVGLGFLLRLAPADVQTMITGQVFTPLLDTFIGLLNALAGPMIFLAVVSGIYSMGDADTFSTLGKRLSGKYMLHLCAATVIVAVLCLPVFRLQYGTTAETGSFSALYEMVLNIIPGNLFTPLIEGNTLQILFVAIIMGVAMIVVGEGTDSIAAWGEQISIILQAIMGFINRLVPFYIFGSLFNIVVSSDFSALRVGGGFFVGTVASCVLVLIFHTVVTCVSLHISPKLLWKKALQTFLIGLSTASSVAAFSTNMQTCKDRFGIDERLSNFGVPFGQVIYKPGASTVYLMAALSVASFTDMEISVSWVVIALVMSLILSVATPAIPGGSMASFSVVFVQLGLPTEQLAMILALNVILDFAHTATNLFSDQCVLLMEANSAKLLNRETLLDPNK